MKIIVDVSDVLVIENVRLSYTDTNKDGIIQPRQYFAQFCDGPYIPPFQIPNCISSRPGEIMEVNNYYPFGLTAYTETIKNNDKLQ